MKRRNLVEKNIVKAISVGAVVMACSPMTARAAELETDNDAIEKDGGVNNVVENSDTSYQDAQDAASDSKDAISDAADTSKTVKDDVKDTVNPGDVIDAVGNDLSEDVIDAADKVDDTKFSDADADIENTNIQLNIAKNKDELSENSADTAKDEAEKANEAVTDAEKIVDEANKKIDTAIDALENASSLAEAEDAFEELKQEAGKAKVDFDAKLAEYNNAKAAAEAAAAKVAGYEASYNAALENADANAEQAAAELEAAKAQAQALENAVADAKKAVDESAEGALKIKDLEDANRTQSYNWRSEDELFIAIMENY